MAIIYWFKINNNNNNHNNIIELNLYRKPYYIARRILLISRCEIREQTKLQRSNRKFVLYYYCMMKYIVGNFNVIQYIMLCSRGV